jgi:hypothetical protein
MKLRSLPFWLALVLVVSTSTPLALAQSKAREAVLPTRGEKGPVAGAADENISDDSEVNAPDALKTFPKPADKGGAQKRGAYCGVYVDNYTPFLVRVYVDGQYRGAVPAWGGLWIGAITGATRLYSKATFADGATLVWKNAVECKANGRYKWRLTE